MNNDKRRSDIIYAVVQQVAEKHPEFRPGDVADFLREKNQPIPVWEIRGELSKLETAGLISNDPTTGNWQLTAGGSRKTG